VALEYKSMDLYINTLDSVFWVACQNFINSIFGLILAMIRCVFGSQLIVKDLDSDNH